MLWQQGINTHKQRNFSMQLLCKCDGWKFLAKLNCINFLFSLKALAACNFKTIQTLGIEPRTGGAQLLFHPQLCSFCSFSLLVLSRYIMCMTCSYSCVVYKCECNCGVARFKTPSTIYYIGMRLPIFVRHKSIYRAYTLYIKFERTHHFLYTKNPKVYTHKICMHAVDKCIRYYPHNILYQCFIIFIYITLL